MGQQSNLPQIKIFEIIIDIDDTVNEYIVDVYNKTGNIPTISQSGNFIMVTRQSLVETNRAIPRRISIMPNFK